MDAKPSLPPSWKRRAVSSSYTHRLPDGGFTRFTHGAGSCYTSSMFPRWYWLPVLLSFFCAVRLTADPLPADAFDHLPAHPRLYGNAARWDALATQVKTDPASVRLYALLRREADDMLRRPPVAYEKEGARLLEPVREGRDRIVTLAAAARLTGDARYRERAVAEMRALAGLPTWNPGHFLDVAEATGGLALGYDWLYHDLTPADRTLCEDALLSHGLQTSFDRTQSDLSWASGGNNWNQVCNGGLVMGALAVAERDPALARRIVERAADNLHFVAGTYAPDGAFPEGDNYWNFGTSYQVLLIDALHSVLGTTLDLEKFPGFLASVDYHQQLVGPTGLVFDYSDSREPAIFNGVVFWFARQLHRPDLWQREMARLPPPGDARVPDDGFLILPLLWRQPEADRDAPAATMATRWLGRGEGPVVFLRSAADDPQAVFVGLKGGCPTASHAHMDVGSFVLDADGVRWAVDPGMQEYYSLEKMHAPIGDVRGGTRFDIFRLGPDAHSILRFDGARQVLRATATFSASRLTEPDPFAVVDLSPVYAGQVAAVHRGVCLRDDRRVVFRDEWTAGPKPVQAAFQWMTRAGADADATGATLRQDGKTLRLRVLAPEKFTVAVEDASLPVRPYDVPNPGLKRVVVRTDAAAGAAGALTVLAEPGSATGTLAEVKTLADW